MVNPVVRFEVMGNGRASSLVHFYTELFGWTAAPVVDDVSYFAVDTGTIHGISGGIGTWLRPGNVTFYVQVDDIAATLARAEELGGKALSDPGEVANSTVADVADHEGNVAGLVLRNPRPERSETDGENPVVYFEIQGSNWQLTRDFWAALFGWKVKDFPQYNYSIVPGTEAGITGGIGQSPNGQKLVTVYVQVSDLQAILDRVEHLGGKTVNPVFGLPDVQQFAHFADPDGNIIGLMSSGQQR